MHPQRVAFDIDNGVRLSALSWTGGGDSPTVVAVHGITANAWCWGPVARHLDGDVTLVAIDLRGRGASAHAPGPTGQRRHADDVAALIEQLGGGPIPIAGHSMGTYVALMAADRHPASVGPLVLVDGAVPLALPEGLDAQQTLEVTLGPALARLQRTFGDTAEYRAFWAAHPAFASTDLAPEIEAWLLADLEPTEDGGVRSCVREEAVRTDGAELFLDEEVRSALDRLACPATIVRAELGLLAEPPPMVPADAPERYPQHRWITVPGTNHYDVLVGEAGAAVIADAIRAAVAH